MIKYLVGSAENDCVFTTVNSAVLATKLVQGGLDFWSKAIFLSTQPDLYNLLLDPNYFTKNIYKLEKNNLVAVPADGISEYWLKMQKVMHARRRLFCVWEVMVFNAYARLIRYHCADFPAIAKEQIKLCDISGGVYTPMIEDYARVLDQDPGLVCKDLSFQIESDEFSKFKIVAMAEKWAKLINSTDSEEEINSLQGLMQQDFVGNAMI